MVYISHSVHKINHCDSFSFIPTDYSLFKYGDKSIAKQFAFELFNSFLLKYRELILEQEEIFILPSPYYSINTASGLLCKYFSRLLNEYLYTNGKKSVVITKIHRNHTYTEDYGNLDFNSRLKLISNDTYYIDKLFINNKFCILIDDIKITGSHEVTILNLLKCKKIKGTFLFLYYAELLDSNINPKIENYFNNFFVKDVKEVIYLLNNKKINLNTRLIKFILNLNESDFIFLVNNVNIKKIKKIFYLAISNNYHYIADYRNNIDIIYKLI